MQGPGRPDLVVAVDFGMTCCGVAYSTLASRSDQVFFIQKWPGRAQASENKVPTSIVYNKSDRRAIAWGFASDAAYEQNPDKTEYKEWFKILLDPVELQRDQQQDPEGAPQSMEEVEALYEDFLRLLYDHIELQLSGQLYGKAWRDAVIEFTFSLPTTWTDKSIVERFRAIIFRAGYTRYPAHFVAIGLTEAEAAAVQVAKRDQGVFQPGDVMLVCDAGGGTTDLSVQRVDGIWNDILSLQQLDVVQGRTIGSASIDADFERLARSTLENARNSIPFDLTDQQLHELSWSMMKSSEYQNMKCEFGSKITEAFNTFTIPAKKLPPSYINQQFGISDQCIRFQRKDFQELFDSQLTSLFALIDNQLDSIEQKLPGQYISHLVLSGGLGNSPYVLGQLKARYEMGGTRRFASTEWLKVRVAPEPQLAVCKGIVEDRVQNLSAGQAVLDWRCCRESYGVACKELYDANNPSHAGRQTQVDEADGRLYVVDGIDWFIKAGDLVSSDKPIVHNFFRIIADNDTVRRFSTKVYVSRSQYTKSLPNFAAPGSDVHHICTIDSNLSYFGVEHFEAKGRQPWSNKKPHYRVRYQIKAIVGPGDLRFELWFNGSKVNIDQAINVEWFATPGPGEANSIPQVQLASPIGSLRQTGQPQPEPPHSPGYNPSSTLSPPPPSEHTTQHWYTPSHSPSELEALTPRSQPSPPIQTSPQFQQPQFDTQSQIHAPAQPSISPQPRIASPTLSQSSTHSAQFQPGAQFPASFTQPPLFHPQPQPTQSPQYSQHFTPSQSPNSPVSPPAVYVTQQTPSSPSQTVFYAQPPPMQQPGAHGYQAYPFPQPNGSYHPTSLPQNTNLQPPAPYSAQVVSYNTVGTPGQLPTQQPVQYSQSPPPTQQTRPLSSYSFVSNFKSEFGSLKAGIAASRAKRSIQNNPYPAVSPSSSNAPSGQVEVSPQETQQLFAQQPFQQAPYPQQSLQQQPFQQQPPQQQQPYPQQPQQQPPFAQQPFQQQPYPPQPFQQQHGQQQPFPPQQQQPQQQRSVSGSNFAGNFKTEFSSLKSGFSSFKQRRSASNKSWG